MRNVCRVRGLPRVKRSIGWTEEVVGVRCAFGLHAHTLQRSATPSTRVQRVAAIRHLAAQVHLLWQFDWDVDADDLQRTNDALFLLQALALPSARITHAARRARRHAIPCTVG